MGSWGLGCDGGRQGLLGAGCGGQGVTGVGLMEMKWWQGMGWAAQRAGDALQELLGPGSCSQGQEQRFRKEKKTP